MPTKNKAAKTSRTRRGSRAHLALCDDAPAGAVVVPRQRLRPCRILACLLALLPRLVPCWIVRNPRVLAASEGVSHALVDVLRAREARVELAGLEVRAARGLARLPGLCPLRRWALAQREPLSGHRCLVGPEERLVVRHAHADVSSDHVRRVIGRVTVEVSTMAVLSGAGGH